MAVDFGDVLRVTMNQSMSGSSAIQNTFFFRKESGGSISEAVALAEMETCLATLIAQLDDSTCTDLLYVSLDVYNVTKDRPVGSSAIGSAGTVATDPLPPGVSALVTLDTGEKRGKGRKFIAGIAEANTTAGVFTGGTLADLGDFALLLINIFTGGGLTEEWRAGLWRETLSVFKPFISYLVSAIPAYQRRRKQNVGA